MLEAIFSAHTTKLSDNVLSKFYGSSVRLSDRVSDEPRMRQYRGLGINGTIVKVSLAILLTVIPCVMVRAQAAQGETIDIAKLVDDLNDIDSMRPLLPLKLTSEQCDKLISLITAAQSNYDRSLRAVAGPALAKFADQIRTVKLQTAKGEAIPKDFDTVAKEAETEILSKRKALDAEVIAGLSNGMKTILTAEQFKLAGKLDKDALIKLNKVPANKQLTDDQWFASYVRDAIFTVPRIVPVLKMMKEAIDGRKGTGGPASSK